MRSPSMTQQLAQRIVTSAARVDDRAIEAARAGLLDFLASALSGLADPGAQALWNVVGPQGGTPSAAVIGMRRRTGALNAALLNGYLGHALDYDDVHASARGHPSTVILPAILALAEELRPSARDFLAAYVVGVETMCRLGLAMGKRHYEVGWHSTAILGPLAASAACACLMGLDEGAAANALGLAATQSGGLRVQFGSEAKPLHAGLAARAGLLSAKLAAAGMRGSPDALDGPLGYFAVFGGEGAVPERAVHGWGEPWQMVEPGLWFKCYPCCSASHHGADAALALKSAYHFAPHEIANVTVTFPPGGDAALTVRDPATAMEGKFSAEYVVAAALIDGELGLGTFTGDVRPDVRSLMKRVVRHYDAGIVPAPDATPPGRFTVVTVTTVDGAVYSKRVDCPRGAPGFPLSEGELRAKFMDAARGVSERYAAVPDLIARMETENDLARLLAVL